MPRAWRRAELQTVLDTMDWDQLFGSSNFVYKNIRRKTDARDYPSRLEFGLKGGIVPPTSLNSGEYVELFLERIAAPYHDIESFDALPTPFRTVAVDLVTASQVVLRRGSLADAMRATMSLPLIFPPVVLDGHVLVDGGAMNNVPADVVKSMGADVVIAVNVGDLSNPENLSYTMLGLAGSTLDAMMRASTKKSLESADVVLNVPLHAYGSLDWRRADELADEGYRAAEAMRDQLLPLAVSEAEYEAWRQERRARRRTAIPDPDVRSSRRVRQPTMRSGSSRCSSVTSAFLSTPPASRRTWRSSPASIATRPSPGGRRVTSPAATGSWCAAVPRPMRRRS